MLSAVMSAMPPPLATSLHATSHAAAAAHHGAYAMRPGAHHGAPPPPTVAPPAAVATRGAAEGAHHGAPAGAAEHASAVASAEKDLVVVGLHGVSRKQAVGMRLRIYYNEEGVPVPYGGVVESVDTKRGLKVLLDGFSCPMRARLACKRSPRRLDLPKRSPRRLDLPSQVLLDGYSKREWVTDEDEWEWDYPPTAGPAVGLPGGGPRPIEAVLGTALFRDVLTRLLKSAATCEGAAKGELPPAPPSKGKRAASGAPKGAADGTAAAPADESGAAPPEKKPRKRPAPKTAPSAEDQGAVVSAREAIDEMGDETGQRRMTKQAHGGPGDLSNAHDSAPSGPSAKPPGGGGGSTRKRKVEAEDAKP
jgi:hypothetical protein